MRQIVFLISIYSFAAMLSGCKPDEPEGNENFGEEPAAVNAPAEPILRKKAELPPLPPPKPSAKKLEITKKQEEVSPFKQLGCCADEARRMADTCCCQLVLEKYKKLVASNSKELGKRDTDPIYGDCRKILRKEFDLIDNPPIPGAVDPGL